MTAADISVLLVDDHAVVREGYRRLLEVNADVHVCGEAADAAQAYQRFCALRPDVVVMDVSLPGASGIEAMRRMLAREADARVLIFSVHEEAIFVRRALDAGGARLCDESQRARRAGRSGAHDRAARQLSKPRHFAGTRAAQCIQRRPARTAVVRARIRGVALCSCRATRCRASPKNWASVRRPWPIISR